MATLELVEKLRAHANVSYEEAKAALDATGDDLLDAVIYLEKQGKVSAPPAGGSYTAERESQTEQAPPQRPKDPPGENFGQVMGRFLKFCGRTIHKGNTNLFDVWRRDELVLTVPITVLVLLLIFCFWFVIPLAVVGLFFGFRYRFRGQEIERIGGVNKAMDSAAEAAETLKGELKKKEDAAREETEKGTDKETDKETYHD